MMVYVVDASTRKTLKLFPSGSGASRLDAMTDQEAPGRQGDPRNTRSGTPSSSWVRAWSRFRVSTLAGARVRWNMSMMSELGPGGMWNGSEGRCRQGIA